MDSQEVENVCKYLRSKEIQILSDNNWLINCINWYKSHLEQGSIYGSIQEFVCSQWLLADLQDVQQGCLPPTSKERNMELSGRYPVQINWLRDIGQSCYTQLKATLNVNASESNDDVTTDEPKKQNWEPNPKRVLMLEITDGITTLKAMEYSPIAKLTDNYFPGLKVVLIGPIECRKGILFLKNNNISILGGEVDYLNELNSKENLLSRCLNLTANSDVVEERETNGTVTSSCNAQNNIRTNRSQLFNDIIELPDSTSAIEDRDMLMSDEDDDFFRQLPLDCGKNSEPGNNELSPALVEQSFINSRPHVQVADHGSITERSILLKNNSVGSTKPKLFPALDDLRPIEREIIVSNEATSLAMTSKTHILHDGLASTSCAGNPKNNCTRIQNQSLDQSFASSSMLDNSFATTNTLEKQRSIDQSSPALKVGNDERDEHFNINETQYPQLKKVLAKVESIVKLKIRNGEWFCCANVFYEEQYWNVTFSNKVLEILFGIPASEVEVWRGEMNTNPILKKKVNDILKAGQTKLKVLNCQMTIEYSSEGCTPHVVIVHI